MPVFLSQPIKGTVLLDPIIQASRSGLSLNKVIAGILKPIT